jgi:hypothetical protein
MESGHEIRFQFVRQGNSPALRVYSLREAAVDELAIKALASAKLQRNLTKGELRRQRAEFDHDSADAVRKLRNKILGGIRIFFANFAKRKSY